MKYLYIGGSKSGKSKLAEEAALKLNKDKVIYIATMKPYDDEDRKRIEIHIKNRTGFNFQTIEMQTDIEKSLEFINEGDTVLIDSITSLLTNEMFKDGEIIKKVEGKIVSGVEAILNKAANTVIVSDYIFNDSILYDEVTEGYKKQLGLINRKLARLCENVYECSFENIKIHKSFEL